MKYEEMINSRYKLSEYCGSCGRFGSLQCDGDGPIAIYNLLKLLDRDITLEEVVEVLRKSHYLLFGGIGGLNVFKLRRALHKFNVKLKRRGFFTSRLKLTKTHKFILYYFKTISPDIGFTFQAGRLVKDSKGNVWIELFNPFHRYASVAQFKKFEGARHIVLFEVE